ncbi:MAG: hypothetical protein WDN06_14500 [Asticcacaulis sp.]
MTSAPNDPERLRRKLILDAFDAVLDVPAEARAAWLREHFAGDDSLVVAVEGPADRRRHGAIGHADRNQRRRGADDFGCRRRASAPMR